MPYLALIDQLSKFIRQKSALLIIAGYSFNDEHLNDTIINALRANPSAMVLAVMFGSYFHLKEEKEDSLDVIEKKERYPKAYKLAIGRHNLNIWTNDKAIIGTNLFDWGQIKNEDDNSEIRSFVENITESDHPSTSLSKIKMGDFSVFTSFLKILIGTDRNSSKELDK